MEPPVFPVRFTIYFDPPFNSNANYNVLFAEQDGSRSAGQIEAFTDTWRWDEAAVLWKDPPEVTHYPFSGEGASPCLGLDGLG